MTAAPTNGHAAKSANAAGIHPAPMIDSMMDMQKQLLEYAAELNQVVTTRVQAESELAAELAGKLAAARSIPDAASAWQHCMQRQIQLNVDDARRLIDQNQKFIRIGSEIFSNGGAGLTT